MSNLIIWLATCAVIVTVLSIRDRRLRRRNAEAFDALFRATPAEEGENRGR